MNPFDIVDVPTFGDIIRDHAARRPDAPALSFGNHRWSYAALDAQANRIARGLLRCAMHPGDRVAWLGRNSDVVALLAIACARARMIFVPVNWRLAPLEVAHILADSGARAVVLGEGYAIPDGAPPSLVLSAAQLVDGDWLGDDATPPRADGDDDGDARETVLGA